MRQCRRQVPAKPVSGPMWFGRCASRVQASAQWLAIVSVEEKQSSLEENTGLFQWSPGAEFRGPKRGAIGATPLVYLIAQALFLRQDILFCHRDWLIVFFTIGYHSGLWLDPLFQTGEGDRGSPLDLLKGKVRVVLPQ